jgi:hypothetical protein
MGKKRERDDAESGSGAHETSGKSGKKKERQEDKKELKEGKKERKEEKKERKESKKEHKSKKERRKERKEHASSPSASSSGSEEERELPSGVNSIDASDYFLKHDEFRVWLHARKRAFFSLRDEEQRRYFDKFVKCWNEGSLERELYAGVPRERLDAVKASEGHEWAAMRGTITDREQAQLDRVDKANK